MKDLPEKVDIYFLYLCSPKLKPGSVFIRKVNPTYFIKITTYFLEHFSDIQVFIRRSNIKP
jgi:hypothetical protein